MAMINAWLVKHVRWYRRWQDYRHHDLVHYVIFVCFALYDIYAVIQLELAIHQMS